jgi:lipoprotein NlpI
VIRSSQPAVVLLLLNALLAASIARAAEPTALEAAETAYAQGRVADARDIATRIINAGGAPAAAFGLRAACLSTAGDHAAALTDYDQLVKLEPSSSEIYDARGSEQFMLGKFTESIADFDRAIELQPRIERGHWKRGISYYYAGRYTDGQKQFEGYQQVDGNDVENAVWRFLCMARSQGVEKARKDILLIRNDGRVPMMQIYALYSGAGTEQGVADAVAAGDPKAAELNARQFYADLYLGLYAEATGDKRLAQQHIDAAKQHKVLHYMWDVARVHADLLRRPAESNAKP